MTISELIVHLHDALVECGDLPVYVASGPHEECEGVVYEQGDDATERPARITIW